jgi:hypothetical protein
MRRFFGTNINQLHSAKKKLLDKLKYIQLLHEHRKFDDNLRTVVRGEDGQYTYIDKDEAINKAVKLNAEELNEEVGRLKEELGIKEGEV